MNYTPYTQGNADFSNSAHMAARRTFYPAMFGVTATDIDWDSSTLLATGERGQVLDGEMGIDRIALVTVDGLRAPLRLTVQERFRRPQYQNCLEATITEWLHNSNRPSELHKIAANFFVYGFYDATQDILLRAVTLNMPAVLLHIMGLPTDEIDSMRQHWDKKNLDYLKLGNERMFNNSLVVHRMNWPEPVFYAQKAMTI